MYQEVFDFSLSQPVLGCNSSSAGCAPPAHPSWSPPGFMAEPPPASWGGRQKSRRWAASIGMKEKKMWVHHLGNWECHSRLRHPKQSCQNGSTSVLKATTTVQWNQQTTKSGAATFANCKFQYIFVQIYTHQRIFTKRFPGHAICSTQVDGDKDNKLTCRHMTRPTGLPQGKACGTRRKEMERAKKKKMWVHHVCNWDCRRRLRHTKRFFAKNL